MICTPKSVKIFSRPNGIENIAPLLVCITLQYILLLQWITDISPLFA